MLREAGSLQRDQNNAYHAHHFMLQTAARDGAGGDTLQL